jgi:hypothetical protein
MVTVWKLHDSVKKKHGVRENARLQSENNMAPVVVPARKTLSSGEGKTWLQEGKSFVSVSKNMVLLRKLETSVLGSIELNT